MELGYLAGLSPFEAEDWTEGEIRALSEGYRHRLQHQAMVAYIEAQLTVRAAAGKKGDIGDIYEEFPGFWTEEEIKEAKVEKVRKTMLRHVAQRRKGGET